MNSGLHQPLVTIVIVPRERFSYSRQALDSLFANTDRWLYNLVYVDVKSPPRVAKYLQRRAVEQQFQLIRLYGFATPNKARNIGLEHVKTKYVLFLDNDCEVSRGWLPAMLRCAEATDAWAVAPLYFERDPKGTRVHMSGAHVELQPRGKYMEYVCTHTDIDPALGPDETDLFEFHCVLLRNDKFECLDEMMFSALEQEDIALNIRQAGGKIFLEPEAKVTYVVSAIDRHDAAYIRFRWAEEFNRLSVDNFGKKWGLAPGWGESTYEWCNHHRERILRQQSRWARLFERT